MAESNDSLSDPVPRFPPSVTVALLKDAAARATFMRAEIAELKSKYVPVLSPRVTGSPGSVVESAQSGYSPATSYHSWKPVASEEWKAVVQPPIKQSTFPPNSPSAVEEPPEPCHQTSYNATYEPESQQPSDNPTSSPEPRNSDCCEPASTETARDHVMQRMKNVNAALKEIEKRKRAERKAAMSGADHVSDAVEQLSIRESRVRIEDLAEGHHHNTKTRSNKNTRVKNDPGRRPLPESHSKPLSPPKSSTSPAMQREVVVAESRISLANLGVKARPSRQSDAKRGKRQSKVAAKRGKPSRARQGPYGQAAQQRGVTGSQKVPTKKRSSTECPLDEVLGPWDNSNLDQSVGVLLASVDRKIAHEYHAVASTHRSRSPSSCGTSMSVGGSPTHEKRLKTTPRKSPNRQQEECGQNSWQAALVPNEAPMPPAMDPFFERDPEELARELYPDSPLPSPTPSTLCAAAHASSRDMADVQPKEETGVEVVDVTVNQGTYEGSLSLSPLPSAESPKKMERQYITESVDTSPPYATVASLLGPVSRELSRVPLFEIMREVAVGTAMKKRKTPPDQFANQNLFWGQPLTGSLGGKKTAKGSTRKVQLVLDGGRAIVAYRRGSLRQANHGVVREVHIHSGSWESGFQISVITNTFAFHLVPSSARDYYVWITALNAALNYMSGPHLDFSASATDTPLHLNLHSVPPVMSLAQWASPGRQHLQ